MESRLEICLELYEKQLKVIEEIESQLKIEKAELYKLQFEVLPDVMAEIGSNEIKVGEKWFRIRQYISAKINDANYDSALDWIESSGYGSIKTHCIIPLNSKEETAQLNLDLNVGSWERAYERKIHHKTLEAAVREMIRDDIQIPSDLISVTIGNFVKIN